TYTTKLFLLAASLPLAAALQAADAKASDTPLSAYLSTPPDITTTVALTLKESYDSNVYLQNVAALAGKHSFLSTAIPSISTKFVLSPQMLATLSYSAEINEYHSAASESNTRHNFGAALSNKETDWSYSVTGGVLVVDGAKNGLIFSGAGGSPAIGGGELMNRRDQDILTGNVNFAYTPGLLLLRPVITDREQYFRTTHSTAAGYQNDISRSENTGGVDLGWKSTPTVYTFVSYRVGHQHQDNWNNVVNNYSNSISRLLIGFEGTATPWCTLNVLIGQDTRTFTATAVGLNAPDRKKVLLYSNSSMTLKPTKADTLTLSYVRFMQPTFSGRNAYEDLNAIISWAHALTADYTLGAGYRVNEGNFLTGNRRDEIDYYNVNLGYKLNKLSSLTLDFQNGNTRTSVANGIDTSGRNFTRNLLSLTYKLSL
ncbi:MAG: hypothetical protein ACHQ5A_07295, partial [Opitutales bacterium]